MTANAPHRKNLHITLPIAPNANHRKVGDDTTVLDTPLLAVEAINWLQSLAAGGKTITGIELCGPGDVLTSWSATKSCLDLLADHFRLPVSLTCLGFSGSERVPELLNYNISRVTVLVDAVSVETVLAIYQWLRPEKKTIPLVQGAALLLAEQEEAITTMLGAGLDVVIRTEVLPGLNDNDIVGIAKKMAGLGIQKMELIGGETVVEGLLDYLDVALLDDDRPMAPPGMSTDCLSTDLVKASPDRPYVAVASSDGMDVNLHLGQAEKLLIYGPREDGLPCLIEVRESPEAGGNRWQDLANLLPDCFAMLASHAGTAPREQLAKAGINVILVEDQIEGVVDVLFGGGKKKGKCEK